MLKGKVGGSWDLGLDLGLGRVTGFGISGRDVRGLVIFVILTPTLSARAAFNLKASASSSAPSVHCLARSALIVTGGCFPLKGLEDTPFPFPDALVMMTSVTDGRGVEWVGRATKKFSSILLFTFATQNLKITKIKQKRKDGVMGKQYYSVLYILNNKLPHLLQVWC